MTPVTRPVPTVVGRAWLLIAAVLVAALVIAGCGSSGARPGAQPGAGGTAASGSTPDSAQCPTENTIPFAKTKFVTHAGLAFGAFHRYLWKPYRAGALASGAHGRIVAFVKAGLAAGFIAHEVRLAADDAKANPTLCRLIAAPLAEVAGTVGSAVNKLKNGDASDVTGINNTIGTVENAAAQHGVPIQENDNPNLNSG